jgi:hypothetical protein
MRPAGYHIAICSLWRLLRPLLAWHPPAELLHADLRCRLMVLSSSSRYENQCVGQPCLDKFYRFYLESARRLCAKAKSAEDASGSPCRRTDIGHICQLGRTATACSAQSLAA